MLKCGNVDADMDKYYIFKGTKHGSNDDVVVLLLVAVVTAATRFYVFKTISIRKANTSK